MSKLIVPLLILFTSIIRPQEVIIRSLKAYTLKDLNSIPVLTSPSDLLTIEFDVQSTVSPNIHILFKYCDRYWNATDNIFLLNQGKNVAYTLNWFYLPTTIEDAKYHYTNTFPDKDGFVEFPFSGKWKFYIVDSQDYSKVFAEGKFINIKVDSPISIETKRETLEDKSYFPPQLSYTNWVIAAVSLREEYFPFFVDELEIIPNHLFDNPIRVPRNSTDPNRYFEWDGGSNLVFTAKDVRPGNEYRQVNLNDINIFNSKNVKAQFDGMEYTRFLLKARRDLNGGFVTKNPKDIYSNYMNVKFSLKPPDDIYGDIYLVGAFNDWKVSEKNKMYFNGDHFEFTALLKRGVYDYQFVVVNGEYTEPSNQDWLILEGNDWDTTNEYNILLWYRDQEYGGYDRIIGYSKIQTR